MAKPGVMFYFDIRPCIKRLNIEERGRLFEAILDYGEYGIVPELEGVLGVAWDFIQPRLDRDAGQYDRKVEQRQYAAFVRECRKNGGEPPSFEEWRLSSDNEKDRSMLFDTGRYPTSTTTSTTTSTSASTTTSKEYIGNTEADKPPTRHRFSPPSVEDVQAYCQEKGYKVNAQRFVDYYTSNGWRVGKNPMKDWRAAVRNWGRKDTVNGKTEPEQIHSYGTEL